MTLPESRNRLWLNRMDPEQHYGIVAMEPTPRIPGRTLNDRLAGWQDIDPLYDTDIATLRAYGDEAYLWLLLHQKTNEMADEVFIGFDMLDPKGATDGGQDGPAQTHQLDSNSCSKSRETAPRS